MMSFKTLSFSFLFSVCCFTASLAQQKQAVPQGYSADFKKIETGFIHISPDVQTSVYWYWISGNISKEGVIKDLEAMKKVGINRAFIGNIGLDDVPYGKVKMFTEEWWKILHAALKTATRLNIEIGIFNSPGWSQSGGPWVKPEQSMRYLTSSKVLVKGSIEYDGQLVKPQADFQDVRVVAYPVAPDYAMDLSELKPILSSIPVKDSLSKLMDNNLATSIHLKAGAPFELTLATPEPFMLRSLLISTTDQTVRLEGDIQVKSGNAYTTIKHFEIDRTNSALNVGFIPFGPAAISIPPTSSAAIRIVFTTVSSNCGITELKFSSTPLVENYIEKTLAKMWPTPHPFWQAYQWAAQPAEDSKYIIDPATVQNISSHMTSGGRLTWKVPAGNWIIERSGMSPTQVKNAPAPPEGTGLEVDKMSKKHIAEHFNAYLGKILERIPAADRKTWKVTVEDSYETGGQNWTDDLITEFREKYLYDPVPYIPVLQGTVVGSEDASDRFLWDLRRLVADDVSFKYVGGLREISHQHGLTTWLENYGHWGYPGEFLQYGGQSDEIGGEFWSEGDLGDIENRAASSSAHIYGKTKVSAESFTAAGSPFARYPAMFKKRGDRFFTEGINNTLLHVYIEQPDDHILPGVNAWFGVEFNRLNTWFYSLDVFLQYSKRCNMMLQQGRYAADAAYFIGEDAPKMTGVTDPALPQGYSFDYINGDILRTAVTVKDGRLVLPSGISYGILVLPKLSSIRPELLAKLKDLVARGAVILGPKPDHSPSLQGYPESDVRVKKMAAELWGDIDGKTIKVNRFGKGMVLGGMDMYEAMAQIKLIPDLKITGSDSILFIHRELASGSIYFISNQKNQPVSIHTAFRLAGKKPELWDAITGSVHDLPHYTQQAGITSVPLKLAPYGSAFIIFRTNTSAGGDLTKSNNPLPVNYRPVTGPWSVQFSAGSRGPVKPVIFNTLTDWSINTNDSIKYYSGTAVYHNTIRLPAASAGVTYMLDLGKATAIAKVYVNGIYMGGTWTWPYQVDISKALKPGNNKLEISVVNTWVNRLLGDGKLPEAERKTRVRFGPDTNSGLQPSGLFGPVQVKEYRY